MVVGGGVVGTAIAAQLAGAGQRVALAEASSLAAGASGAAPGRLNPPVKGPASGPVFDLHVAETARYQDHISQLRSGTGLDPEYRVPGLLLPAFGEEAAAGQQDLCAALMAAGVDAQRCDAAAAAGLEPRLNPQVRSAVWIPGAATVHARRLTAAQAKAAELAGSRDLPVLAGAAAVAGGLPGHQGEQRQRRDSGRRHRGRRGPVVGRCAHRRDRD